MEQNNGKKGTGRILRHKIINLMYLIFIVLAFLYIPSNFIDVFKNLNSTFEKSASEFDNSFSVNQLNNLYNFNTLLFTYLTQSPDKEVQGIKTDFDFIHAEADSSIRKIEQIKEHLISEAGGFNEYGYLKNSKNYKASEFVFFKHKMADSLLGYLIHFKKIVKPKINAVAYRQVDQLIETNEFIEASTGELKTWAVYYFGKMPVSGAVTILSKFQNDIRRAGNAVIESYINLLSGNRDSLLVDVYNNDFNSIRAFVTKDGRVDSLSLDSSGRIKFFPYEAGKYVFTIYDKIRKIEKTFIVKDIGPVVQQPDLPVLYAGIDNLIHVEHPDFSFKKLKLVTSLGQIIKKKGAFYLRMNSQGLVKVKVFGITSQEEKLLAVQDFMVRELPDLKAKLNGMYGESIRASQLANQNQLLVGSELSRGGKFKVDQFHLKRVHKQSFKNSIEVEINEGAVFDPKTKQLLAKSEPGDMYIFEDIVVKSLTNKLMKVPALVLTVN